MSDVENGETRSITRWGLSFLPTDEPYETYDTYDEALAAFESMKVKHQRNEHIVRVETIITEVYNGDHISWDDAYGDNSAKAGIIEAVQELNKD